MLENSQTPDTFRHDLVKSFSAFEAAFRKKFPVVWMATLLAPVVLTIGGLVVVGIISGGWEEPSKYVSHALATFFFFGRFIILFGAEGATSDKFEILLSPMQLFGLVTYMDFVTSLFVTFHMGVLFRIPYVGKKIAMLVWDGKFIMNVQPWVKRIAFFGLVLFVIFPTSTTGSIGGAIFGRLLGMSRWLTVSGVLVGSVLGNGLMYAFAKTINQYISPDDIWIKVVGIAVIVVGVLLLEVRYRFIKEKYVKAQTGGGADAGPKK